MNNLLVLLVGPSAIGKSSIEEELCKVDDVDHLTIYTSRDGREEDVGYKHLTVEEIHESKDLHVYAKLSDSWVYAISDTELLQTGTRVLSVITNKVASNVQHRLRLKNIDYITVFIDSARTVRVARMIARGESSESIEARLEYETLDVSYVTLRADIEKHDYDYTTDFDEMVIAIKDIILTMQQSNNDVGGIN